jgi:hypothetical protein
MNAPESSPRENALRAPGTRSVLMATIVVGAVLARAAAAQPTCGEWNQVDPPAGATNAVTEVEARSADDAFAFAIPLGLIHWDGTAWSEFPITDPFGDYPLVWIDEFDLVGPSHLFLAGRGDTGPFSNDQVLRFWDGTGWSDWESLTLEPDIQGWPRNGAANAVVGAAPDDVWILGIADSFGDGVSGNPLLTVHWDGSQLIEYITPGPNNRQNNVYDAVGIASDDIWAVGGYNNTNNPDGRFRGLTYHWDGTSWSHIPNPSEDITEVNLYAVTAIASDDVWAAGGHGASPFFMHWDGSEWNVVPSPATTGTVYKIAAIASDDVWAVDHAAQVPVIGKFYHWDGVAWRIVLPPDVPGATAVERHGGLAAVGECDVWAVGSLQVGQNMAPFIERLQSGGGATAVPTLASDASYLEVSPNPLLHSTRIRFAIPGEVPNRARIYNVRGRRVRTLFEESISGNAVTWDGRDDAGGRVPGGVYFLRVESSAGRAFTEKLTVVR